MSRGEKTWHEMVRLQEMVVGQKENAWGPQVAGSIFPFTGRVF